MLRILKSPEAENDLDEIWLYIEVLAKRFSISLNRLR